MTQPKGGGRRKPGPAKRPRSRSEISLKTGRVKQKPRGGTSGQWKKGESGNPAGRPPLPPEYKESIAVLAKRGLDVLAEILETPKHPRREHAAEYVVNRQHGNPIARSEIGAPGGGPFQVENLTTAERLARIKQLEDEAAAAAESDEDSDDGSDA